MTRDGLRVVAPSDVGFEGGAKPTALTTQEVQDLVKTYAVAAANFVNGANGDGVEIHSANGFVLAFWPRHWADLNCSYLIDQFLSTTSNFRTDQYGGSVENRIRFGLEVLDAVVAAVGAKKVGIRISPYSPFQGMRMPHKDLVETFTAYVKAIKEKHPDLAYLHVVQSSISGASDFVNREAQNETLDFLVSVSPGFRGTNWSFLQHELWSPRPFLVAGGLKADTALEMVKKYDNSAVVFGRYFISNVSRLSLIWKDAHLLCSPI
jgi:NADPH2 dehydrogenase